MVKWNRLLSVLASLLVLCASAWALEPGPFTVKTVSDINLHDVGRNRDLPVSVCYPDDRDNHPLIIFSHGAYSSAQVCLPLAQFWASHGYIIILPTHADSLLNLKRDAANDPWTGTADFGVYGAPATQGTWKPIWAERPRDIRFVLDSIPEIEKQVPALLGRIDRGHIGVGGHSLGAYAASLVSGVTVDIPGVDGGNGGLNQSFADSRPQAVLLLSPQGRGLQGLGDRSWDHLKLPMLLITGSNDTGIQGQPPSWRTEPYRLSPPGDKYLLFIQGANHNSYVGHHIEEKDSNLPLQRKGEADVKLGQTIFDDTKLATLIFWNAYLKADAQAKDRLRSGELSADAADRLKLEHR